MVGFPPRTVSAGGVHGADAVALQAQRDLLSAYDDAAARSSTATISADLAGSTLTPGVYMSASSLGLSGTGEVRCLVTTWLSAAGLRG
jgi:hypothetical protein